jgi:hypothetical protein
MHSETHCWGPMLETTAYTDPVYIWPWIRSKGILVVHWLRHHIKLTKDSNCKNVNVMYVTEHNDMIAPFLKSAVNSLHRKTIQEIFWSSETIHPLILWGYFLLYMFPFFFTIENNQWCTSWVSKQTWLSCHQGFDIPNTSSHINYVLIFNL